MMNAHLRGSQWVGLSLDDDLARDGHQHAVARHRLHVKRGQLLLALHYAATLCSNIRQHAEEGAGGAHSAHTSDRARAVETRLLVLSTMAVFSKHKRLMAQALTHLRQASHLRHHCSPARGWPALKRELRRVPVHSRQGRPVAGEDGEVLLRKGRAHARGVETDVLRHSAGPKAGDLQGKARQGKAEEGDQPIKGNQA